MKTRDEVEEWLGERGECDVLLADGFDEAFIGITRRMSEPTVAVYDYDKCIAVLMERDGMGEDEARESFEFNTAGDWFGPGTPAFMERVKDT